MRHIRQLLRNEGMTTSEPTIRSTVDKWRQEKNLADRLRSGRIRTHGDNVQRYIEAHMQDNNELTAGQLRAGMARDFTPGCQIPSVNTILRIRAELGWVRANVRYCQLVRNKAKRNIFSAAHIFTGETFDNHIFTDECTVQLERHRRKAYMKKGQRQMLLASVAKHPVKLHVWAGISHKGATDICIFDGKTRLNSLGYTDIISNFFVPFNNAKFGGNGLLVQDNSPLHTSVVSKKYLESKNVKVLWWPPESPDLNHIEKVWHQLKEHLRSEVKPRSKEELKNGIKNFWRTFMTREQCRRYLSDVPKVMVAVMNANGGPTLH